MGYNYDRRATNRRKAEQSLRLMRNVFTAVPLNVKVLNQAIDVGFNDFEDAIQFHSAVYAGAGCLITRDVNHFPATELPVLSPKAWTRTYADLR